MGAKVVPRFPRLYASTACGKIVSSHPSRLHALLSAPVRRHICRSKDPPRTIEEVGLLIRSNPGITIMPDSDNIGTNGLISSPPLAIPYIFDGKSFKPHSDAAYSKNLTPRIISGSCFALDIDTPKDLLTLLQQHPQNQTVSFLHRSGIAQRLSETKQPQQESL